MDFTAEDDGDVPALGPVSHEANMETIKRISFSIWDSEGEHDLAALSQIERIFEKYQEQPQLLDPHLETVLSPLMRILHDQAHSATDESDLGTLRKVCGTIQIISNVRGPKTVSQFFPHSPGDIEPAVALLQRFPPKAFSSSVIRAEGDGRWETSYVLLLWLSILALLPFDLVSLDSQLSMDSKAQDDQIRLLGSPLVQHLLSLCWEYLESPAAVRDMAVLLLSKLLTRPDMTGPLHAFVTKSSHVVKEYVGGRAERGEFDFLLPSLVATMASVYKVGGRDVLAAEKDSVLTCIAMPLGSCSLADRNPLLRRLRVKLIQRLGLAELPPRVATWRYERGSRSLVQNLKQADGEPSHGWPAASATAGGEEEASAATNCGDVDAAIPEVMEDIIEELLGALKDKDSTVRWSAAKGLGRIAARLPLRMADQVVEATLAFFDHSEDESAWHGACLGLAELAHRGVLLPARLHSVVPLVAKALHYDIPRGSHSVGAHVRDAAAYVAWAFARAYSPEVMHAPLQWLAPHLLTVACYDKEVSCRRAAAAAFQEGVGRQGSFPHGIDIVTTADFASLGPLAHAYRSVAPQIAAYEEYTHPFILELLNAKIRHWSVAVREVAAESLSLLAPLSAAYFAAHVMDRLLADVCHAELAVRHGALLALASLLPRLQQTNISVTPQRQLAVSQAVCRIQEAQLFRGKGGEIMRVAACQLARSIAVCGCSTDAHVSHRLLSFLEDSLSQPEPHVQSAAAKAYGALSLAAVDPAVEGQLAGLTEKHLSSLHGSESCFERRGAALALGSLSRKFLEPLWESVIRTLCRALTLRSGPPNDPETRVNAAMALSHCCSELGIQASAGREAGSGSSGGGVLAPGLAMDSVVGSLLEALDDYTTDNRGDVGSLVREAAMEALLHCTLLLAEATQGAPRSAAMESLWGRVVAGFAKQAVEKIDRTRRVAGSALQKLLWARDGGTLLMEAVPRRPWLELLVPEDCQLNWADPEDSFPRLVPLLSFPEYRDAMLEGLVVSMGGLTESLSRLSSAAMVGFMRDPAAFLAATVGSQALWGALDSVPADVAESVGQSIVGVFSRKAGVDRVVIPTIKSLALLLSASALTNLQASEWKFGLTVVHLIDCELPGKDVAKMLSAIEVLCCLLLWPGESSSAALATLLALLRSRYPKVRQYCAEQLYLQLMAATDQSDGGEGSLSTALDVLSETDWHRPLKEVVPLQERLKEMLHDFSVPWLADSSSC